MITTLDQAAVAQQLSRLNNRDNGAWSVVDNCLVRHFTFIDFNHAFAFMTQVALFAEQANHHPDWSNSYNKVIISLTTHEAKGLTERDFLLAERISQLSLTKRSPSKS